MEPTYSLEAKLLTVRGSILCGARKGYTGADSITLAEVSDTVERIGGKLQNEGRRPIACIVRGLLVGRTGDGGYRERVYRCEFSTSPRALPMPEEDFKTTLFAYACELGTTLQQERMYVEHEGMTYVLRRTQEAA